MHQLGSFAAHIRRGSTTATAALRPNRASSMNEGHMIPGTMEQTLDAVIGWARFGELFAYDDDTGMFDIENPA